MILFSFSIFDLFHLDSCFKFLSSINQLPVDVVFELLGRLDDRKVSRSTLADETVTIRMFIGRSDIKKPRDSFLLQELLILANRHDTVFSEIIPSDTMVVLQHHRSPVDCSVIEVKLFAVKGSHLCSIFILPGRFVNPLMGDKVDEKGLKVIHFTV